MIHEPRDPQPVNYAGPGTYSGTYSYYTVTQSIGAAARTQGYSGILFPAARADGGVNIVVFNPADIAVQP